MLIIGKGEDGNDLRKSSLTSMHSQSASAGYHCSLRPSRCSKSIAVLSSSREGRIQK